MLLFGRYCRGWNAAPLGPMRIHHHLHERINYIFFLETQNKMFVQFYRAIVPTLYLNETGTMLHRTAIIT